MTATDRVAGPAATVFVGLGSNIDQPIEQVRRALAAIGTLPDTRLVAASSLYRNPPMGLADQPDYVNAVAQLRTGLSAPALLRELQGVEERHGRVKSAPRWDPRCIDLDILLFGSVRMSDDSLTIPHPGLHQRSFVLYPLYEIAPDIVVPGHGRLSDLLVSVADDGLEKLSSG